MPSVKKITAQVFESTDADQDEYTADNRIMVIGELSVINNTQDTESILQAFMNFLQSHAHPEFAELQELIDGAQDDDMMDELLDVVYTRMESLATDGYYFGANGMGTWNYGYWRKSWI